MAEGHGSGEADTSTPKYGLPVGDVEDTASIPAYRDEDGALPEAIPPTPPQRRWPIVVGYVLLIVLVLVLGGIIWAMATGALTLGSADEEESEQVTQPSITMSTSEPIPVYTRQPRRTWTPQPTREAPTVEPTTEQPTQQPAPAPTVEQPQPGRPDQGGMPQPSYSQPTEGNSPRTPGHGQGHDNANHGPSRHS